MKKINFKNQFQKAIEVPIYCDICGAIMYPMYGGGFDNDRIVCIEKDCQAEITYPSSTEITYTPTTQIQPYHEQ